MHLSRIKFLRDRVGQLKFQLRDKDELIGVYEVLTVYHGGTDEIKSPLVHAGRPNLDFGPGFYVIDLYLMNEKEKVLHRILTATQTGTIVCRIAETLDIPTYEAFRRFIRSKTYANFRVAGSALSMCGNPAIVDEFLRENK